MRKHLWKIGVALGALVIALAGATALAAHAFHRGEFMRRHVSAFIDDALDAAKVSDAQRASIHAARDQAFAAFDKAHERHGELAEVAALFEADKIDNAKVEALRAQHHAQMKAVADAVQQAITQAHDVLTPAQREAVVAYVREHRPGGDPGRHERALRVEMMKRMATNKLDDALDAAKVTAEQRPAIYAARDQLFQTLEESQPAELHKQVMERALALFAADRVDEAAVRALRAEQEAHFKKIGDAVVQAAHDLHDALTPAQRKAIVEYAKAQHAKWREHGPGGMHHGRHGARAGHAE